MSQLDLIPFRHLIDRVVNVVRPHLRSVFLPIAVPLTIISLSFVPIQTDWMQQMDAEAATLEEALAMLTWVLVLVPLMVAGYVLIYGALSVAAMDAVAGRPIEMRRAWRFIIAPRAFLTLFLVTFLMGLSFLFCLIPALYVVPVLSFVLPVMVAEKRFGMAAIQRSIELAQFNPSRRWATSPWLQIFLLLFVGWVVQQGLTMLVQLPFVVIQQVIVLREAVGGDAVEASMALSGFGWLQAAINLLGALIMALTWCYPAFGLAWLYQETRRRREGTDLEQAIDALTV